MGLVLPFIGSLVSLLVCGSGMSETCLEVRNLALEGGDCLMEVFHVCFFIKPVVRIICEL